MRINRWASSLLQAVAIVGGFCPRPSAAAIVDVPVTFHVTNQNHSAVLCQSDGAAYDIKGHLVAPDTVLAGLAPRVTLYLHGLGYGDWFWHFTDVSGYDYATEMASLGHASVVINRIGYEPSGQPNGFSSCIGAQADVAHQIIDDLKHGTYVLDQGGVATSFNQVALAGHSAGGLIAEVEAYSFHDIDALLVMGYADQGTSMLSLETFAGSGLVCLTGGQPAQPGGPGGYAYFGQTGGAFQAAMFHDADPAVVTAATAKRQRDPCGDYGSAATGILQNQLSLRLTPVTVPVLLVCGANDALFPPSACEQQKGLYLPATLEYILLPNTGHALTLENSAPSLRQQVSDWLTGKGF